MDVQLFHRFMRLFVSKDLVRVAWPSLNSPCLIHHLALEIESRIPPLKLLSRSCASLLR